MTNRNIPHPYYSVVDDGQSVSMAWIETHTNVLGRLFQGTLNLTSYVDDIPQEQHAYKLKEEMGKVMDFLERVLLNSQH